MKKIKGHDQLWGFFSIQAVTHADVESGFQWKSGDSCVSSSMHSHLTEAHLLKATVLSRVSHRIVLVSDAAASQLHGKSKNTTSCTKSHHRCKQWGKMGHTHTHRVGKLQSLQSKIKDKECFTFLGYGGIEECWIYLGSQARISASFPRTWKLNQTLLR